MIYQVRWRVYPRLDLVQMSSFLSGLVALSNRGRITLSFEYSDRNFDSYMAMELLVTRVKDGSTCKVVCEFHDDADKIYPSALEFADRYFKRQFDSDTRVAASRLATAKIEPLGLVTVGFPWSTWRPVFAGVRAALRTRGARRAHSGARGATRYATRHLRNWLLVPAPDSALRREGDHKSAGVVCQPRLWSTEPGSGDVFDVANEDRIALVRILSRAFPAVSTIGLVRNKTAQTMAADLMLNRQVRTREHHRQLRTSTVAVNCLGLDGSVGWKLAEYFAAGCAVVSPPITKEFLAPVEPDVHYLSYASPEQCVEQCRRLLGDPDLTRKMGQANRAYFDSWIDPAAQVGAVLERAFQ